MTETDAFPHERTRKDVVLPLLWPIKSADGKRMINEIPLKKNTNVIISILGANRSKAIWGDDAEEWKPERWLAPLPESVSKAHLPGVYASMCAFIIMPPYSSTHPSLPLARQDDLPWGWPCLHVCTSHLHITRASERLFFYSGFKFAEMEMSTCLFTIRVQKAQR